MLGISRRAWLLVVLSAILQVVIFPLENLYVLGWVAIVPLLVAIFQARRPGPLQLQGVQTFVAANAKQGFLLGYACGILWYAGTCYWVFNTMKQYGGIGTLGAFGLLILFCLYLALYHGAFGLIISLLARKSLRLALIGAPFAWVAVELARTRISGFPWDLLGTTQVDNIPLARVATFAGVYGMSFEIMIVNTAVAAAFIVQRNRRRSLVIVSLLAACLLQAARWVPAPAFPADHKAVLVQANVPVLEGSDWTRQYFDDTVIELSRTTLAAAAQGHPNLIVWPESPAPFYTGDPVFRNAISQMASTAHAWMVVGSIGVQNAEMSQRQPTHIFNSATLVSPSGEWDGRYDKIHLVPFGEYVPFKDWLGFAGGLTKEVGDFSRGSSRDPLQAGDEKLGIFICYESVFPDEVRRFADQGAQVLVNISNDGWYGDSGAYAQHLKQARMRAVENARWLLRDTNTGVTAAIDPYGRVVQQVPRKTRIALVANYALENGTTFYTRHGDWLAYACAIITIVAVVLSFMSASFTPGKGTA
jgi:apolipoprotein N-acyltransferase